MKEREKLPDLKLEICLQRKMIYKKKIVNNNKKGRESYYLISSRDVIAMLKLKIYVYKI